MLARVKSDYRWKSVMACGGAEFVKSEFRPVPPGREAEARNADMFEIAPDPEVEAAPVITVITKKSGGRK